MTRSGEPAEPSELAASLVEAATGVALLDRPATEARERNRKPDPDVARDAPHRLPVPIPDLEPEDGAVIDLRGPHESWPAPAASSAASVGANEAGRETAARYRTSYDQRTPTAYLPGLDGLRALAVIAVVAYHLEKLPAGFLGVDVFFVVSGFLITRLLLAEHERSGRVSFGNFWLRRFKRLVPALLVVLVAVAAASRAWLPAWRLRDIRTDGLAALGYVANWRFVWSGQSYFTRGTVPSPLRHTWSLAIEEQFYLLWPLVVVAVIWLARRHARRALGVLCLAGVLASATWMAVSAGRADLSRVYYGTDTRIFALLAGAFLATWWDPAVFRVPDRRLNRVRSRRLARAALVALPLLALLMVIGAEDSEAFYRYGFQATAVLSLLLVAGVATGWGLGGSLFANPVLVWLGRRSYGIYLWSWPVQIYAAEHFGFEGWALVAVVFGTSIALAALSFWLVEEPVRRGTRPRRIRHTASAPEFVPQRRMPRPAFAAVAVALVAVAIAAMAVGAPSAPAYLRASDSEAVSAALAPGAGSDADLSIPPTTAAPRAGAQTTAPLDLPPGPFDAKAPALIDPAASVDPATVRGRPLTVMIAGDSVGWSLGWQLGEGQLTDSLKLHDRAVLSCGVMPYDASYIVHGYKTVPYADWCDKQDLAEARGLSMQPDVVLLWAGAWEVFDQEYQGRTYKVGTPAYRKLLEERLQQRVDRYRALGVATIIPRAPCFGHNAAWLGHERHEQRRIRWVNARVDAVAKRNPGWVRVVDPTGVLCDGRDRSTSSTPTGVSLREDGAHFTPDAAVWFWNTWLAGQMGAAFENGTTPWPPPATATTATTIPPTPGG